jgi:hypothetical protein
MAGAIQAALEMLSSGLGGSISDPEDSPVLGQLDLRVLIAVGDNRRARPGTWLLGAVVVTEAARPSRRYRPSCCWAAAQE